MLQKLRLTVQLAVMTSVFAACVTVTLDWQIGATPQPVREGWAGPEAVALSEEFVAAQPPFQIDGVYSADPTANVRLWKLVGDAAPGGYPQNTPQEIGDCTSWGTKHAVEATTAAQIADGQAQQWRPVYAPFTYGAARVKVLGGRIRGDGATGASVAEACKRFGILFADVEGVPPYSGAIAKQWGSRGPPAQWFDEAAKYRVQTTARVTTAHQIRDAVCNGYGVIICSDWGAEGRSAFRQQDGRMVAKKQGSWMHCMCVDGYDGSAGTRYYHITNSWGPTAHPAPIDDSPPGGFWIEERDMDYIARQGDSWALSEFDGFPARPLPPLFGRRAVGPRSPQPKADHTRKTMVAL